MNKIFVFFYFLLFLVLAPLVQGQGIPVFAEDGSGRIVRFVEPNPAITAGVINQRPVQVAPVPVQVAPVTPRYGAGGIHGGRSVGGGVYLGPTRPGCWKKSKLCDIGHRVNKANFYSSHGGRGAFAHNYKHKKHKKNRKHRH